MKLSARIGAVCALGLLLAAGAAHAKNAADIEKEVTAMAAQEIHRGDTPEKVAAFLKAHHFFASEYSRKDGAMVGHSMYGRDGRFTTDQMQAAFAVHLTLRFDSQDRLQDWRVEVNGFTT